MMAKTAHPDEQRLDLVLLTCDHVITAIRSAGSFLSFLAVRSVTQSRRFQKITGELVTRPGVREAVDAVRPRRARARRESM